MPSYLPIRAFNRSQKVRIGNQTIKTTTNTYIDVDDAAVRKQLGYHSAIGAVYVTGPITDIASGFVVQNGGVITTSSPTGNESISVTATSGSFVNRDTGANVSFSTTATPIDTGDALTTGQSRIVLVYANGTTGAIEGLGGTATTGTPVAPTLPSGKVQLAQFTFSFSGSTGSAGAVTDLRQLAP